VKVKTTRFGDLDVNNQDVITFKEGILGFDNLKRFFIVDPNDQTLILWLQSIDDEKVAFPMIEPKIFKPDFIVSLLPAEMLSLNLESINDASIYTVLTIPSNVTDMSANLKAPIVINSKMNTARQIVLQNSKLEVRYPMYTELKKYIVSYASDDSRRTNVNLNKPENASNATASTASVAPKNKNNENSL
jgi:flagellar assembly factor FliW